MIVKARAVILIDRRLIVANQRRRGRSDELETPEADKRTDETISRMKDPGGNDRHSEGG